MALVLGPEEKRLEPICSICIANYNGADHLDAAVRSIFEQTFGLPVEIIVHDDASSDASATRLQADHPKVVLIESQTNVGFCVANNRMVERARGRFVLLLNNDAVLFPNALEALHRRALSIEKPAILALPQYDASNGKLVDCGSFLDLFLNPVPNLSFDQGDVAMVIGACLWLPKSLWSELEGFPAFFQSIAEDMLICCRARIQGFEVRVATDSGYRHWVGRSFGGGRVSAGALSTTFKRRSLSERNKSFVMAVVYPSPWVETLLPLHLLMLLLEAFLMTVLKRESRLWRDIYQPTLAALFKQRRDLLALRRAVQKKRRISSLAFFKPFRLLPHKLMMFAKFGLPQIR
jgi:GT2 family glycosyltransferase